MTMYKENFDPGFQELTPQDFAPIEVDEIKSQLISQINAEFIRLKIDSQLQEYLCHSQIGTTELKLVPAFNLGLFQDYLKKLVAKQP